MKNKFLYVLPFAVLVACNNTDEKVEETTIEKTEEITALTPLQEKAKTFFGKLPVNAATDEYQLSEEKIALGKKLYFDNRLSKDNTISCNSCHNLENGSGVDNLSFSPGNDEGSFGGRNAPTTLNAALHIAQFWDGRAKDVEEQAGGPILNPVEMAMPSKEAVIERLRKIEEYPSLFAAAFPSEENSLNYRNIELAIGAFERTLITPSKFDEFIGGNANVLSEQETKGLETFITVGCNSCHMGNVVGGNIYQKFGVFTDYWELTKSQKIDEGRFEATKNEADKYFFKTPSLRNIEKTAPYFHDGSVENLEDAVTIMAKAQLNKELTSEETANIVAFLKTLSGELPATVLK
jgi:cytochrome c peroxidase